MKNDLLTRAYIVAGSLALAALLVFGQTFKIAVQEGDRWRAKGDSLHIKFVPVEAPRGNILAADGSFLATSQQHYEIRMDTRATGLTDEVFERGVDSLAALVSARVNPARSPDSTAQWMRSARERGDRYLLIRKRVDYPTYLEMRAWPMWRHGQNKGGFIAKRTESRRRPFGMMAQRTIGYRRDDASVGLEGRFHAVLGGEEGRRPMMRLPGNHYLPVEDLHDASPTSGSDIQTTLDVTVQDAVQQEIAEAVREHDAEYGVGIVLETATGAVRAITSLTKNSKGVISESFNHAVGTRVEPGSTFKLASMLALLDAERVTLDDPVRVFGGKHRFYDREMVDASAHGLDTTTARRVFEISSNVGVARLVERGFGNDLAGRKAFVDKLRQFRLDRQTGIQIAGETFPYIKDPTGDSTDAWSGITLPWMSMGYELELTPLQLAAFYNAVANDGQYVQPQLVRNVQREGVVEETYPPLVLDRAIASRAAIRDVQSLLRGVVDEGTARRHRSTEYAFAGKTGTVQYNYSPEAKERGESGHQASFIGYFPADDPRYTMLVLISKPKSGRYYGSDVALPAWRRIADKLYASDPDLTRPLYASEGQRWRSETLPRRAKGAHADLAEVFAQLNVPAFDHARRGMVALASPGDTLSVLPLAIAPGQVPDVRGMGARDAMFLLEDAGCRVDLRGRGRVTRQSIRPGTKANGQYVKLTLG